MGSTGLLTFSATLTRNVDNSPVSSATVSFTVDGGAAGSAFTNAAGVATLSYNPSALMGGSHPIQASFAGQVIGGATLVTSTSGTQTLTGC